MLSHLEDKAALESPKPAAPSSHDKECESLGKGNHEAEKWHSPSFEDLKGFNKLSKKQTVSSRSKPNSVFWMFGIRAVREHCKGFCLFSSGKTHRAVCFVPQRTKSVCGIQWP